MNNIQIDCAAYGIGRGLNRINWYDMSLREAYKHCMEKAEKRGATKEEQKVITKLALKYVINQNLPPKENETYGTNDKQAITKN